MESCSYSRTTRLQEDIDAVIDQDQGYCWFVNGLSISPQADWRALFPDAGRARERCLVT